MSNTPGPKVPDIRDDLFVAISLPPALARVLAAGRHIEFLELGDIMPERLSQLQNALFACELFTRRGDALTVIAALNAAKASGHLVVIAPPLPDPIMVERELRAQAEGFSLSLAQP